MTKPQNQRKTLADLIEVMAALRTPETGCPWDLKQTFETIAPYTLEEAYEVADAIARGDLVDLKEELGDLLLQVVYHARMAEEESVFDFGDVADGITRKMIRRHPHVFGTPEERAAGAQPGFWARIKGEEKSEKAAQRAEAGLAEKDEAAPSVLDDVPLVMPALVRAYKLQKKASKVGFDWPKLAPVFDKVREEIGELEEVALGVKNPGDGAQGKIEEEFGDLLFALVNLGRHLKLDPEAALRGANDKFQRRFVHVENRLAADGRSPADSDLEEMDRLWDEAKRDERSR